ncbi:MAG: hypothetical protein Q8Q12_02320 [bacterium]|nr:hypothetical protein [bacterium]
MMERTMNRSEHRDRQPRASCQGIALLLTLGILLLLTLLALSFSSSQLTENQAARNFYYAAKAEEIALGGLDTAISVLKADSKANSYDHLLERWAIYYTKDDGFAGGDSEDADLSDFDELEYGLEKKGHNFLDFSARRDPWEQPTADSRWIMVAIVDPATGEKRLAGRFAVCIEDENAKVNTNTAGNPDPQTLSWEHRQNMGFTTAEVNLGAVFEGLGNLFGKVFSDPCRYPHGLDSRTAHDIVAYRYGWRPSASGDDGIVPGLRGDDNSTERMPPFLRQNQNGIDDDGDGQIDEPGEETDEPGEFDPYEPTESRGPGQLLAGEICPPGTTGLMGDDTPFLTVSHIKMAESRWLAKEYAIPEKNHDPPYPKDRLYRCLLPYVTVYSHDPNRYTAEDIGYGDPSAAPLWASRENIARWFSGPSQVRRFLNDVGLSYHGGQTRDRAIRQIAVNLYDFLDPDWYPTQYGDIVGIEPTAYLNEIEPNPPIVPGPQLGFPPEVTVEDYGEFIELWNPYDIPIDVANYYVTIDESAGPQRIGPMAVASTVVSRRSFFVIGDTLGEVRRQGGVDEMTLPPFPLGCQAYAPINLDPPFADIYLEMEGPDGRRIRAETHYPVPFSPPYDVSLQKDDPRVGWDWKVGPPTPGRVNATVSAGEDVYSSFYAPGIRTRVRDPSFNPSNPDCLKLAGGLSSIGELGMVHRAERWQTLNFTGQPMYANPADAWLLDLLTLPYQYRLKAPSAVGDPVPARENIPGRININTAPPEVLLGLNWDGMIEELDHYYGLRVNPALRYPIIQRILERRTAGGYRSLAEVAADIANFFDRFPSLGSAPEAAREAFMRYNVNLITTRSNIFKITVLAQAFDRKENVAATRRLEAIVDRGYTLGSFPPLNPDSPTPTEKARAEAVRTLYFRWITDD